MYHLGGTQYPILLAFNSYEKIPERLDNSKKSLLSLTNTHKVIKQV